MSKRLLVGEAEYLESADYERGSLFPQEAIDDIVGGVIAYPAHWAAFTVARKSAQEVIVSPGRLFEGRVVYEAELSATINLTTSLPLAASDEKWVALILRGEEVSVEEDRYFETSEDPETSELVKIPAPVIKARIVKVIVQQGSPVPAPASQPTIAATDACIAFVRLTTQGVQDIEPGERWRAKSLFEVEGRVTAIEQRVDQLFEDTETIRTDVAGVARDVAILKRSIPDERLFAQIVRDTARLAQVANLPDEARNYWFDQALVKDDWDFTQGGFFRILEGIRFQYANQRDHLLRVLNLDDPNLSIFDNRLVLPKYTETTRVTSPEGAGRKDIANTVHTVTTAVQKQQSHTRIRYGETVTVCENVAGWYDLGDRKAGEMFKAAGENWVAKGVSNSPYNDLPVASQGHMHYDVQRIIKDTYTTSYTEYNTETFGLSGAVMGQTFLNAQMMVATSIDLNFTRVGATGDVMLCLCEVNAVGAPDYEAVIARVTKPVGQLKLGWNKFSFEPTLIEQGRRYGWFTVTTGNHRLMMNSGNAYGGGSSFVSSDGIFSQGSTTEDFTFRLNAAKFAAARVVVPMESLQLDGGMTEIDMVFQGWEPAATKLVWEVKAQGQTEWVPIDDRVDNPLANLPPLVQLRAVFIGTQDVMPALNMTPYARVVTGRMRGDMRAITKLIPFGFATAEAQIVLQMDAYDAARHTAALRLILANGTVVSPDAVAAVVDPGKPSRTKFTADFTLPAGTTGARVRIDATTNSIIHVPFGQDVQLNAF